MLRNYLKTAWRNLTKNKLYSMINIGGLAIGMAVSFMLLLYVYNEFSFDKFNKNGDRLYRVFRNQPSNGELTTGTSTPVPLAAALSKDFPEIDQVARTDWPSDELATYQDKAIQLNVLAVDPAFLTMFSFDFIAGQEHQALADPSSIVLTQSGAKALFGDKNPVGQTITLSNKYPLKVSAVIKDNPTNSSFSFKALISWDQWTVEQPWVKQSGGWGNYSFFTYVMLKPDVSLASVNAKLKNIVTRYDPVNKENTLFLYLFARYHLYSDFKNGINTGGSIDAVKLFLFLAIGILLIACINFMNLSTARSERRAREVGVRKAVGARRFALIQQFMGESLLMAFMALLFAMLLVALLMPRFNDLMGLQLSLPYHNPWAWAGALGVTVFTGLVAGSYPALFLSSFKPVRVLKGQLASTHSTVRPRQILVVVQFTFAVCLILSSIFIYKQINYIKDRPVGYDRNGLVELPVEGSMMDNAFESFRQEAINAGAITDGTLTSMSISNNGSNSWGITWHGQLPGEDKIPIDQLVGTYHILSTYGMKLVEGRDFSRAYPADSTSIILNQAAVQFMRFKQPLGQIVNYQGRDCKVVGVVQNFVWGSPYEPVKPAIIGFGDWKGNIALRLNPGRSISASIAMLQGLYKKYNPRYPFQYGFTDDKFNQKFNDERLLGTMSAGFTCLAVIISCLGLFGLASFAAEQRKKEIAIRKVLGASTGSLWAVLSREFVGLVMISFVLGSCICWYYMHEWLYKYTYHTPMSIWVFALTMLASLVICLLTVSWQAIKAAFASPVKSLGSE